MNSTCRVCMTSSGVLVDIFTVDENTDPSLEHMFNECVDVKVQLEDKYPKQLCEICMADVYSAYRFKQNLKQTHKPLNNKPNKGKSERENVTDLSKRESAAKNVYGIRRIPALKRRVKVTSTEMMKQIKEASVKEKQENNKTEGKATTDEIKSADKEPSTVQEIDEEATTEEHTSPLSLEAMPKKRVNCKICSKTLCSNSKLLEHVRIHTGERPFRCEKCNISFRYSSNLTRHQRNKRH